MFMEIAIGAIGLAVVLMVGYLVVSQVKQSLPTSGLSTAAATGIGNAEVTVYSAFSLVAVGIIILAAFGIVSIFRT